MAVWPQGQPLEGMFFINLFLEKNTDYSMSPLVMSS